MADSIISPASPSDLPTLAAAEQKFQHVLASRHKRYTYQRQAIFRRCFQANRPVSFWELEHEGGYATVWSTLKLLLACGLVREVEPEPPERCQYCSRPWPAVCRDGWRNYGWHWRCAGCHSTGRVPRMFSWVRLAAEELRVMTYSYADAVLDFEKSLLKGQCPSWDALRTLRHRDELVPPEIVDAVYDLLDPLVVCEAKEDRLPLNYRNAVRLLWELKNEQEGLEGVS